MEKAPEWGCLGSPHVAASTAETAVGCCVRVYDRYFKAERMALAMTRTNAERACVVSSMVISILIFTLGILLSEAGPACTPKIRIPENALSVCRRLKVRSTFRSTTIDIAWT